MVRFVDWGPRATTLLTEARPMLDNMTGQFLGSQPMRPAVTIV